MVIREIRVVKKYRDDPIPDHPINFAGLYNLHLELLENKLKLKQGVPVNPVVINKKVKRVKPEVKEPFRSAGSANTANPRGSDKHIKKKREGESIERRKRGKPGKKPRKKKLEPTAEDEMIDALKDDGGEDDVVINEAEFVDEEYIEQVDEEEDIEQVDIEEEEEEDDELSHMTPEEREVYDHKEYEWRFRILRKKYKQANIPNYNQHSDLDMMKRDYERIVRELQLDDSVETYKQYLFGGFMAIELVCTQFIGVDLGGFTALQSRMMPKYERMLIELGEKSYTTWGSSLPVEIRLIGFVILQAGIFFLAKVIADKFGETGGDLFKGFMGQPPDKAVTRSDRSDEKSNNEDSNHGKRKKKKKMRGPRINVSDIRDMKKD